MVSRKDREGRGTHKGSICENKTLTDMDAKEIGYGYGYGYGDG